VIKQAAWTNDEKQIRELTKHEANLSGLEIEHKVGRHLRTSYNILTIICNGWYALITVRYHLSAHNKSPLTLLMV
jgi:hypothetical protein